MQQDICLLQAILLSLLFQNPAPPPLGQVFTREAAATCDLCCEAASQSHTPFIYFMTLYLFLLPNWHTAPTTMNEH